MAKINCAQKRVQYILHKRKRAAELFENESAPNCQKTAVSAAGRNAEKDVSLACDKCKAWFKRFNRGSENRCALHQSIISD